MCTAPAAAMRRCRTAITWTIALAAIFITHTATTPVPWRLPRREQRFGAARCCRFIGCIEDALINEPSHPLPERDTGTHVNACRWSSSTKKLRSDAIEISHAPERTRLRGVLLTAPIWPLPRSWEWRQP